MKSLHRRLSLLLLLLPVWAVGAEVTDGQEVPGLAAFDQAMMTFMVDNDIPDGQLAMTWQGRLVLARAYSNDSGQPVNNRSRFRVASVSKPITSTLLHHLQQNSDFSIAQPAADFLDFTPPPGQLPDARLGSVTVRQLLEHLAGFGAPQDIGFDPMFHDRTIADSLDIDLPIRKPDIQRFMSGRSLLFEPGTTYAYSNYGYMLAGRVLEAASGLPYGAYADTVFNAMGIYDARLSRTQKHRAFAGDPLYESGFTANTVMSNAFVPAPLEYGALNYENVAAAGGWSLSMIEAVRWLSLLDDPQAEDAPLDGASLAEMFGLPENWQGPYTTGEYYYGSGWAVRSYGNTGYNTWHAGSLPSTSSYVVRIRDGWNYAVAFNRRDESFNTDYAAGIDQFMAQARNSVGAWPVHDLFPQWLRPAPADMGPRHSGSWYDPTHDGEGFIIQANGPDSAVVYWFTYDAQGQQRWYFGVGQMEGHRLVVRDLLATRGGRFGPDFDPDDVEVRTVGALVLNFYDDDSGKADYLVDGASGAMELQRITQPYAMDDPANAGDWRNGLWYDPAHNGEGFVVEVLPGGTVVVYWFTYDDQGAPAWMVAQLPGANLEDGIDLGMLRPVGGNFGVAFDPALVERLANGSLLFSLGCSSPRLAGFSGGGNGFADVNQSLDRLTEFMDSPCP